jgi:uroporphyrinogen-III synthase
MKTAARLEILRATLRCARHRRAADRAALAIRVDCTDQELWEALAVLEADGLVVCSPKAVRLTLEGLAVAVASISPVRQRAAARARSAA